MSPARRGAPALSPFWPGQTVFLHRAELRSLPGEVYFDQDLKHTINLCRPSVQFFGKVDAVQRVDHVKETDRNLSLVRLEMTDEVPGNGLSHLFNLFLRFLDIIFAEDGSSCLNRLPDSGRFDRL